MDKQLKDILKSLPPRRPRSRLEPYADLIAAMRRRDWPFRDIARVLAERCNINVSPSNVHHFVKVRTVKSNRRKTALPPARLASGDAPVAERNVRTDAATDVDRKIAALKQRRSAASPSSKGFEYDPSEPLRLPEPGKRKQL